MNIPNHLKYTETHEWLLVEGDTVTVGISDHAQNELTDVVFVDLPKIGRAVTSGDQACVVESVKAASEIYSPVTGTICAVNSALSESPGLVNSHPYSDGWLFKVTLSEKVPAELLDASEYSAHIGSR